MNNNPTSSPPAPARKSVLLLVGIVGLAAVALVLIVSWRRTKSEAQPPEAITAEDKPAPIAVAVPEPDRSAVARQLIKSLSEVNLQPGELPALD
jgi:hypothetical protein